MDKEIKPMDKTPIQQAIDELLKVSDLRHLDKDKTINLLRQLLPTERQFAETCFDAGVSSERNLTNNFDNFFKQYTHE